MKLTGIFSQVATALLESRIYTLSLIGDEKSVFGIGRIAMSHPKNTELAKTAIKELDEIGTPLAISQITSIGIIAHGAADFAIEALKKYKDYKTIEDMIYSVGLNNPTENGHAREALSAIPSERAKLACSCLKPAEI